MDPIIEALVGIEEKANALLQRTEQEKEGLPERIDAEIARRRAVIDRKADEAIQLQFITQTAQTEQHARHISENTAKKVKEQETLFQSHRKEWRAKLFAQITDLSAPLSPL